ncbi:GNAT family N-acetyltransferase [Nocardioides sp. Bht2]|uniref:GNAT family N-acetyltransferase n=1 Tax=Nocardioides sp. Bht2 TaxID=3392297 RepID=UPI0039B67581
MSVTNVFGQPIGEPLPEWAPCPFPDVMAMNGRWSRVEPLMQHHADELFAELAGPDDAGLWTWLPVEMPTDKNAFVDLIDEFALATDRVTVVIRDADGVACGMASYLRIDRASGAVEVGWIVLGKRLQRTVAATEAMYLLGKHVFALGYRRYEWKCDALNAASRGAAERLGFTYEGTFRKALVYKGRNRDTAWYSITDDEWPSRAAAFEAWLAPSNQQDGVQVRSLASFRDQD